MEGKCLCHVGYVGESCVHQACVKNSCAGGYKCNWMLGRCESSDTPTSRAAFLPKAPAQVSVQQRLLDSIFIDYCTIRNRILVDTLPNCRLCYTFHFQPHNNLLLICIDCA